MSNGHLTGMAGVYFVAAQASLRGLIASPTSRSAMAADLLITDTELKKLLEMEAVKAYRLRRGLSMFNMRTLRHMIKLRRLGAFR